MLAVLCHGAAKDLEFRGHVVTLPLDQEFVLCETSASCVLLNAEN